eukprot:UN06681
MKIFSFQTLSSFFSKKSLFFQVKNRFFSTFLSMFFKGD